MKAFAYPKDASTKHDYLKFSARLQANQDSLRERREAYPHFVGLWDVDVGQLMGRSSGNTWNRTVPGRPSG
jgi:hypothetical protein